MRILAIDPGNVVSAFVVLYGTRLVEYGKWGNYALLSHLRKHPGSGVSIDAYVIEKVSSYGMAVGYEVFDTCEWSGRFFEAIESRGGDVHRLYRQDIKLHLCGTSRAKDANVRQALMDRYGGKAAIGRKKTPGPLYGVSGDVWAALAVGVCWQEGVRSKLKGGG